MIQLDAKIPARGHQVQVIHEYDDERVAEVTAAAGESLDLPSAEVAQEVLVLEGQVTCDGESFAPMSWLRAPAGEGYLTHF